MSFLGRTSFKSFTSRIRPYSHCHYDTRIPLFVPFFASAFTGCLLAKVIFYRMNLDIQYQYREFEQVKADLKEIKGMLGDKK